MKIYLIAGNPLSFINYSVKMKCLSANVKNYKDWAISSEVPNRETFKGQP